MNNSMSATRLKKNPNLMSMALRVVRDLEMAGEKISLQVMGENKFRIVNVVNGKPQENPELEKKIDPILREKGWAKIEKGWVVATTPEEQKAILAENEAKAKEAKSPEPKAKTEAPAVDAGKNKKAESGKESPAAEK